MSLTVIKPGMLDTVQDRGRFGYQHLGINPGGAMDGLHALWVNILVGNPPDAAVLEMHFPASTIRFDAPAVIAISGADFAPHLDESPVAINTAIHVSSGAVLSFRHRQSGARTYLAVHGGIDVPRWLGSASTNLRARVGGYQGRRLVKEDVLAIGDGTIVISSPADAFRILHQATPPETTPADHPIRILPGPEWSWLGDAGQQQLTNIPFTISPRSDRMAILLQGEVVAMPENREMMSAPVAFGTIQRLPDGTLMILAADHQTTGGYPRVAQVITADLSRLVQEPANTSIRFALSTLDEAERPDAEQTARISRWQPVFSQQLRNALENVDRSQLRPG